MGGRWAVLAVWATASGCVVSVGDQPAASPPLPPADVAPARDFAVMRPGDYRPAHPQLAADPPPARPADPPIPAPVIKPPAEFVTASLVAPDSPVVAAVRHLEAGRWQEAEVALAALPAGGAALPLLAAAVQAVGPKAGPAGVGDTVRALDNAAAGLAPQAPLEVTRAVLCTDVKGFARYDPLPERPVLRAGKRETVWMYLEVRNVVAQPQAGDRFVVRLNLSLLVRDAATGAVVDQYAEPPEAVVLRGPRRDNSAALYFRAPERPGSYTVTMRVQEPAADGRGIAREVSRTLAFTVK